MPLQSATFLSLANVQTRDDGNAGPDVQDIATVYLKDFRQSLGIWGYPLD
jgi:hypothetical protein